MRHLKAGRKLNRSPSHRLALFRSLSMALIRHERIITTVEKAKEVRPFVERLITLAKKAALTDDKIKALHYRRRALAILGPHARAEVHPPEKDDDPKQDLRKVLKKLFDDIGPRFTERPGGYTRVIKRPQRRLGDGGKTAFLELLKAGETRPTRAKAAPAPTVTAPTPPAPAPAPAPAPEAGATPPAGAEASATPPATPETPTNPPASS